MLDLSWYADEPDFQSLTVMQQVLDELVEEYNTPPAYFLGSHPNERHSLSPLGRYMHSNPGDITVSGHGTPKGYLFVLLHEFRHHMQRYLRQDFWKKGKFEAWTIGYDPLRYMVTVPTEFDANLFAWDTVHKFFPVTPFNKGPFWIELAEDYLIRKAPTFKVVDPDFVNLMGYAFKLAFDEMPELRPELEPRLVEFWR